MTLYIEIEGNPVPAKDVVWIQKAPCGCVSGASFNNAHANGDAEMYVTGEQYATHFGEEPKAIYQRSCEDGFTQEPITEAVWDEISAGFVGGCTHEPRWGRFVAPIPDGMVWTTNDFWGYGRRSFKRHLVAGPVKDHTYPYPLALCGSKASRHWSIDTNDLHETVTCRKCEAKASALVNA